MEKSLYRHVQTKRWIGDSTYMFTEYQPRTPDWEARMNGVTLRILKEVAKFGEVSLDDAIRFARPHQRNHRDQYPLALLLEEGYLGMTVNHTPPAGAEEMREFSLATTLHMFSLPKDEHGEVHYLGIVSTGSIDPKNERVFLKAKGALYLDEQRQKLSDRIWFFGLGLMAGVLSTIASAWALGHLGLR